MMIGFDVWSLLVLGDGKMAGVGRVMGYVWIVLEILVKIGLGGMMGVWQYYKGEEFRKEEENKQENA